MQVKAPKPTHIMITRPRHQAGELKNLLEQRGAAVFVFPTIEIRPLEDYRLIDDLLQSPAQFDWLVMTSVNGVQMLLQRAAAVGLSLSRRFAGTQVAAIGARTAQALEAAGLQVQLIPPAYVAESLAHALIETGVKGKRLLTLRSELARETLIELLQREGAEVIDLPAYTTTLPESEDIQGAWQALSQGQIDWVTFTSASAVRNFAICFPMAVMPELLQGTRIACLGPITAQTARQVLGRVDFEAAHATLEELVAGLLPAPIPLASGSAL